MLKHIFLPALPRFSNRGLQTSSSRYRIPRQTDHLHPFSSSRPFHQVSIQPQVYEPRIDGWQDNSSLQPYFNLARHRSLKIVSWNIDFASHDPASRAAGLVRYLQGLFSNCADRLIIFLQEVCQPSLSQILAITWIQQNFVVVGLAPSMIVQNGIPRPARYFNMILLPISLEIQRASSITLPSEMGRNALIVDVPVNSRSSSRDMDILRLCTTHLESLETGAALRREQLKLLSKAMRTSTDCNVVASLIGGDMNSIKSEENDWHRGFAFTDAWEQLSAKELERSLSSPIWHVTSSTTAAPSHGGLTSPDDHLDHGYTWGYQTLGAPWSPKRLDKFLFSGDIQVTSLLDIDVTEQRVARLGIGLQAEVALEEDLQVQDVSKSDKPTKSVWVSDHFGIGIEIKIL